MNFSIDPDEVVRIAKNTITVDANEYIELFLAHNLDFGHIDEIVTMTDRDLKALVTKAILAGMAFEKEVWES